MPRKQTWNRQPNWHQWCGRVKFNFIAWIRLWLEHIIIICMFLSHFSSGSSSSLKTRVSTRGNFGNSTGGVEKSPMITTAHSVRGGGQQQQRAEDVMSARKQVSHQIKFIYSKKATKIWRNIQTFLNWLKVRKSRKAIYGVIHSFKWWTKKMSRYAHHNLLLRFSDL